MKKILMLLLALVFIFGCAQEIEKSEPVEVGKMAKVLMVVAPENFRDEECFEPKEVFENQGFEVTIASKGVTIAKGSQGREIGVDKNLSEVAVADYDAIVFIGGPGAQVYFDDVVAHQIAEDAVSEGKVLAAICIAPNILAKAGVLKGKRATVWGDGKDIEAEGAEFTGEDVTVDGKIVTANGPGAAKKFGEKIAGLLG